MIYAKGGGCIYGGGWEGGNDTKVPNRAVGLVAVSISNSCSCAQVEKYLVRHTGSQQVYFAPAALQTPSVVLISSLH